MKTREYLNLNQTVRQVRAPGAAAPKHLLESAEPKTQSAESNPLVEEITNTILATEEKLGIEMTQEEVAYSTQHILEQVKTLLVVEEVQKRVGFELNEDEIKYVLENLNEG